MHRFGFKLEVHNMPMLPPRERDEWIMVSFERIGYTNPKDRKILNMVCQHQYVVYDSDVFAVDGVSINPRHLSLCRRKERWSDWMFGKQRVNVPHMRLWCKALQQPAMNGRWHRSLGKLKQAGHTCWDSRYCPTEDVICHIDYASDTIKYFSSNGRGRQKVYIKYDTTSIAEGAVGNHLCTTAVPEDENIQLVSYTPMV